MNVCYYYGTKAPGTKIAQYEGAEAKKAMLVHAASNGYVNLPVAMLNAFYQQNPAILEDINNRGLPPYEYEVWTSVALPGEEGLNVYILPVGSST